jgi:hypothetical protein
MTEVAASIHHNDHASQIHLREQEVSELSRCERDQLRASSAHLPPHLSAATKTVMLTIVAKPIGKQPRKRLWTGWKSIA